MSAKIFSVKPAPPGAPPMTLTQALELAAKTGVLSLPQGCQLTIASGVPIQVKADG